MILNVQTNLNQIIPDTIRERKEEKKKQIKFIIQIIPLSIEQDPGTFSKSAIHTMYYFKACEIWYRRYSSSAAIVWYGLTFDTTISGGRSTSEIRGTSRCIAFYGAFYSGVVPDHRSSLLPSSLRSVSPPPTLLSIRPAAPSLFAVKEARAAVQGHGRTSSAILSPLHPRYICYTRPLSLAAPS